MTLFCFELLLLLSNWKETEKTGGISCKILAGFCHRLCLFRFLWIKHFFRTGYVKHKSVLNGGTQIIHLMHLMYLTPHCILKSLGFMTGSKYVLLLLQGFYGLLLLSYTWMICKSSEPARKRDWIDWLNWANQQMLRGAVSQPGL